MTKISMIGRRFGMLTVVSETETYRSSKIHYICMCECGNQSEVIGAGLRSGKTKSCGCLKIEKAKTNNLTHGMTGTPTYTTYMGMRARCNNPNDEFYKDYGAKGIKCEWANFEDFVADMGLKPPGLSIDRIDNNKGYSKSNCRWATPRTQRLNQRRTKLLTINGETKSRVEWAESAGLNKATFSNRIKSGWSIEAALTTPVQKHKQNTSCQT